MKMVSDLVSGSLRGMIPGAEMRSFIVNIKVIGSCLVFTLVGPSLILMNKYIMDNLQFDYPLLLSSIGIAVSGLFARCLVYTGIVKLERSESITGMLYFTRVMPVGIAYAGTLACGNMVYLLLDVGFIQMLKCFTPVVVMAGLSFTGIEAANRPTMVSIIVISFGTALTCTYSPNVSFIGLFVMFMSEVFEAMRLILTQFLLKDQKMGIVEGQYFLAPVSTLWLLLGSFVFEYPKMTSNNCINVIMTNPFMFISAALLGLVVNFLTYFVIQVTSALTLKVLGVARNVLVIIIGVIFYAEMITLNEGIGYSVAVLGFAGYNAAQMKVWKPDSLDFFFDTIGIFIGLFIVFIQKSFAIGDYLYKDGKDLELSTMSKDSDGEDEDDKFISRQESTDSLLP